MSNIVAKASLWFPLSIYIYPKRSKAADPPPRLKASHKVAKYQSVWMLQIAYFVSFLSEAETL